jgi:peroxiredoxin
MLDDSCTRSGIDFTNKTVTRKDKRASVSIRKVKVEQGRASDAAEPDDFNLPIVQRVRKSQLQGEAKFARQQATLRMSHLEARMAVLQQKQLRWTAVSAALLRLFNSTEFLPNTQKLREVFIADKDDDDYGVASILRAAHDVCFGMRAYNKLDYAKDMALMYVDRMAEFTKHVDGSIASLNRERAWLVSVAQSLEPKKPQKAKHPRM